MGAGELDQLGILQLEGASSLLLTMGPGRPRSPGNPLNPGGPSFPGRPAGPGSPCKDRDKELRICTFHGGPAHLFRLQLGRGRSFISFLNHPLHLQGGTGSTEGAVPTLVPSFPVRPGRPCSPGGPGGPGCPRSPMGPVSPVGPWKKPVRENGVGIGRTTEEGKSAGYQFSPWGCSGMGEVPFQCHQQSLQRFPLWHLQEPCFGNGQLFPWQTGGTGNLWS